MLFWQAKCCCKDEKGKKTEVLLDASTLAPPRDQVHLDIDVKLPDSQLSPRDSRSSPQGPQAAQDLPIHANKTDGAKDCKFRQGDVGRGNLIHGEMLITWPNGKQSTSIWPNEEWFTIVGQVGKVSDEAAALGMPGSTEEEVEGIAIELLRYYSEWGSICWALKGGDTILLKGSFLVSLWRNGRKLPRRQNLDLERGACWNADEFITDVMDDSRPTPQVIAISYSRLSEEHADPDGFHLQAFAPLLDLFAKKHALTADNIAVFIDWCSLPAIPRTAAEEELFQTGMRHCHLWFSHWLTHVWLIRKVPAGVLPYEDRGWPFFEVQLCGLLHKAEDAVLDMSQLKTGCHLSDWDEVVQRCKIAKFAPADPEVFSAHVRHSAISEEDRRFVDEKYREAFRQIVGSTKFLKEHHVDFHGGDQEHQFILDDGVDKTQLQTNVNFGF